MSFIRTPRIFITPIWLNERETLAENNCDFNEAISLAKLYSTETKSKYCSSHSKNKAIGWLWEAISYKPDNIELENVISLDDFFHQFSDLCCSYLFTDSAMILLDALKRNTTITELNLSVLPDDNHSDSFNYANKNLAAYIAETKVLKKLNISMAFWKKNTYMLQAEDMHQIANGLKFNTSIEELNIQRQPIGDNGLIRILEALANNPRSKLKKLNILDICLTDKGAIALLDFLKKKNISLTSLDLVHEGGWPNKHENKNEISNELVMQIKKLIKMNKSVHQAYTQGAMFGLFLKIGLPPELGLKTGKYLSRNDGRNIALTSKVAADIAKQEEERIKLSKI